MHTCNLLHKNSRLQLLQKQLLRFSFFNLFVVALLGVALRSYALADFIPLGYKNLLHGHSHFAFGGWLQPIVVWLIMRYFPQLLERVAYHHWRNIVWLTLFSAYGMLLSFPVQGYGPVSIVFSTLAVGSGSYLSVVLWKASQEYKELVSIRFLRTGLIFQVLSFIGPFATGPLIAMGKAGSVIYFDAIYFYLHFQYNGWFSFAGLGLLYAVLEKKQPVRNGNRTFLLFAWSCVPAYFLSILWHRPDGMFYIIGGLAAVVQCAGLIYLLHDILELLQRSFAGRLVKTFSAAFGLKLLLQTLSSLPQISSLAYQQRDFVIAYLHLVLLGCLSVLFFALVIYQGVAKEKLFQRNFDLFLAGFILTESLLVIQALSSVFHYSIPKFPLLLALFSLLLPLSAFGFFRAVIGREMSKERLPASTPLPEAVVA